MRRSIAEIHLKRILWECCKYSNILEWMREEIRYSAPGLSESFYNKWAKLKHIGLVAVYYE